MAGAADAPLPCGWMSITVQLFPYFTAASATLRPAIPDPSTITSLCLPEGVTFRSDLTGLCEHHVPSSASTLHSLNRSDLRSEERRVGNEWRCTCRNRSKHMIYDWSLST